MSVEWTAQTDPICLLQPDGTLSPHPELTAELSDAQLLTLLRHLQVTRRLDREAVSLQRQGQVGAYPPNLGQEACQVGPAFALAEEDWLFPAYRELGAMVVRGVPASAVLHLFRGTWHSGHVPAEHRVGLLCLPIATQTLHATGFAMGARLAGDGYGVLTYLGDGATSEGDAHEAFNFAAVFGAPIVFVIQNNQYAISVPVAAQSGSPRLASRAAGYGIPGLTVDGNDVVGCYAATAWALDRARAGDGPTIIEAVTYRMDGHSTADDATRYRRDAELAEWAERDPITRLETLLTSRGVLIDEERTAIEAAADAAAEELRGSIWDAPVPDPRELFEHVYTTPTQRQRQQLDQLERELAAATDQAQPEVAR